MLEVRHTSKLFSNSRYDEHRKKWGLDFLEQIFLLANNFCFQKGDKSSFEELPPLCIDSS